MIFATLIYTRARYIRVPISALDVSASIREGLDEVLTIIRPGLPNELRHSLTCTNIMENTLGTVRRVSRNVKCWRNTGIALRWTATGMLEAHKQFRRLKAYRQPPIPRRALQDQRAKPWPAASLKPS